MAPHHWANRPIAGAHLSSALLHWKKFAVFAAHLMPVFLSPSFPDFPMKLTRGTALLPPSCDRPMSLQRRRATQKWPPDRSASLSLCLLERHPLVIGSPTASLQESSVVRSRTQGARFQIRNQPSCRRRGNIARSGPVKTWNASSRYCPTSALHRSPIHIRQYLLGHHFRC